MIATKYTVAQTAKMLNIKPQALYELSRNLKLRVQNKFGKRRLYGVNELQYLKRVLARKKLSETVA